MSYYIILIFMIGVLLMDGWAKSMVLLLFEFTFYI